MCHQIAYNVCVGVFTILFLTLGSNAQNETDTDLTVDVKFATACKTPNNEDGYCREIRTCNIFVKVLPSATEELKEYMRKSRCGPKNEASSSIRVCCGTKIPPELERPQEELIGEIQQNVPIPPPPYKNDVLQSDCGKQNILIRNRIFGGMEAQLGEFPWLGRIRHRAFSGEENYGCTAFLIHKKFLLTAAHCVNAMAIDTLGPVYQIVLGEHDSSKELDCVTFANRTICADVPVVMELKSRKTIIHPNYKQDGSDSSHYFDIALIQTKKAVNFTDYIQPICLSDHSPEYTVMLLGGWGKTESASHSDIKLKVEIPRANRGECKAKYSAMGVNVDNSQMCAGGGKGKDSCNGDSGGPLMIFDNDRWFAEGIVSFGAGCGVEGWPGVYTYIPHYLNWIKTQIHDRLEEDKVQTRMRKVTNRRRSN